MKSRIRARIEGGPSTSAWTPGDFLDLGGRDAVDKALQRLANGDELRRIDRGLYDRPTHNSLTHKPNPPDPSGVIDAIARRDQIRVLVDGMTAANDLGLTTAVPAKIVVHTDARLRPIHLGALDIVFRPTAPSKLYWAGRPAMRIVQALHWLRDTFGQEGEADSIVRRLRRLLDDPARGGALKADLAEGLATLPAWMQTTLKDVMTSDPPNAKPKASKTSPAAARDAEGGR